MECHMEEHSNGRYLTFVHYLFFQSDNWFLNSYITVIAWSYSQFLYHLYHIEISIQYHYSLMIQYDRHAWKFLYRCTAFCNLQSSYIVFRQTQLIHLMIGGYIDIECHCCVFSDQSIHLWTYVFLSIPYLFYLLSDIGCSTWILPLIVTHEQFISL